MEFENIQITQKKGQPENRGADNGGDCPKCNHIHNYIKYSF